jgi:hypothetical protein
LLVVLGLWFVDDFRLIEGGNYDDDNGVCLIVSRGLLELRVVVLI